MECRPDDYLTIDVEQDLTRLIKAEIMLHRDSEDIKQRMESMHEYTPEAAYLAIDDHSIGFIDAKMLDSFFRRMFTKNILLEDN